MAAGNDVVARAFSMLDRQHQAELHADAERAARHRVPPLLIASAEGHALRSV